MSNPTSNFNWQMPTNSDLVTDLPADFEVFGQAVDTTMADLKGGTTGQILSKTTNADMDFTWINNDQGDITAVNVTSPITGGGTSGAVTVGIQSASTSQSGAVQLSDSTSTTSSVLAATPTAVKSAYDLAAAAVPKSTVTTNGDLIVGTGSATVSRLGIGANNTVLTSNGTTASWAAPASSGVTYPINPVLNSNFSVWQRGTSFTNGNSATAYFAADRWQIYSTTSTGRTWSRQATSDTTNLPNIQYCMRLARNNGDTQTNIIYTVNNFESVNSIPYAGKTITFSFYARAGANFSASSSQISIGLITGTGTDQNSLPGYTGVAYVVNTNQAITTTWTRYTFTGSVASTATEIAMQIGYAPTGTAGANDYFEITGVQIDVGSSAQAYRPNGETYQAELGACQRYYIRFGNDQNYTYMGTGNADSTTKANIMVPLPVTMRVSPTSIDYSSLMLQNNGASSILSVTALTFSPSSVNGKNIGIAYPTVASGLTQGTPYVLAANGTTNGYLAFSAEL